MNNYFRVFDGASISCADIDKIKSLMNVHREGQTLDYHGYLDVKSTLRTQFAKDIKVFAEQIGLRLAGIYAFTAHAGAITKIHTDGDRINGILPWRLSYYVEGEPGIISWHDGDAEAEYNTSDTAYIYSESLPELYSQDLTAIPAAFVRTDIPHRLDISQTKTDRLTITATFLPRISWQELNNRLDKLNES